jgi:phosphohistidine swiveling domain-containing protein
VLVLGFDRIGHADLATVGGKGANLGEMSRAGFPVPPGFCITTEAYRVFVRQGGAEALSALDGLQPDLASVRQAGEQVRKRLEDVPMPPDIAQAVVEAWEALGPARPYAVRSSATAEDLPDASFAGQQDTILNVIGREALLQAVRRCWISLFTDRAILYRLEHGFAHREVELSVVVQRMVLPEVAGILFTADPITGNRRLVSIDAGFGLGEALVSGKVSADLYHVDARTGKLASKRIAEKHLAIRPLPEGGTVEELLPVEKRKEPALRDAEAEELAELGLRIAAHYGRPQDIEWCREGGELFVVQARPITTLYPEVRPGPADDRLHVYLCWNHIQGMPDAMPTLARSLVRLVNPFGKQGQLREHTPYMVEAGGRLYHDGSDLLLYGPMAARLPRALQNNDALLARAAADVVARDAFLAGGSFGHSLSMTVTLVRWLAPLAAGAWLYGLLLPPEGRVKAIAEHLWQRALAWERRLGASVPGAPRLRLAKEAMGTVFEEVRPVIPVIFGAFLANDTLRWLTGRPEEVALLLRAMPGNAVTDKDLAAADIAELVRGKPELEQHLRQLEPRELLERSRALYPELAEALQRWMEAYGDRAPSEVDASRPRYHEDPAPVVLAIRAALDGEPHRARLHFAAMAEEADRARDRLVAGASWLLRPLVARCARAGRQLLAAREQPKLYGVRILARVRRLILEEAQALVRAGALSEVDDVWHLTLDELIALAEGSLPQARELVTQRRAEHQRHQRMFPPRVLTSDGESVIARHSAADAPEGAMIGTSASPGVVEGRARVVLDPSETVLVRGEILVAPFTDPGWTPLFAQAGGLVMEVGGQMTHGSVVAREYGIPAVVCVEGATRRIADGDRIRVDGDRGWVELIHE